MRKMVCLFCLFCVVSNVLAQNLGIGTTTPDASAQLDVASSNKGFLLPLLSQSQRIAIASPANGLLVYDTTTNRFYQFQDGAWRYIINSELWASSTSASRNLLYNTTDSIGIGTSLPQQRLDVNGDILATGNISLSSAVTASGTASGANVQANGNMSADGSAVFSGNVNGGNDLIIDNTNATLQFKTSGVSKVYFQAFGDDLRMGTNSSNSSGNFMIRMNGKNVLRVDTFSNLALINASGLEEDRANMVIGEKLIRYTEAGNSLPILYGRVLSDGFGAAIWPPSGSSEKISTGEYEIDTHRTNMSSIGIIVVTVTGSTVPRICTGRYTGAGKFRVNIFSLAGTPVDNDFYFTITDPLN